jgi:hypothetical protein
MHQMSGFLKVFCVGLFACSTTYAQPISRVVPNVLPNHHAWKQVAYTISDTTLGTYKVTKFSRVFAGKGNAIVELSRELQGLNGVKLPESGQLKIKLAGPASVFIGVFRDSLIDRSAETLAAIHFDKGMLDKTPFIKNGITVTAMPVVDVYQVIFPEGQVSLSWKNSRFLFLGALDPKHTMIPRVAHLPDGRLWDTYNVDGFMDDKPLFEVIGGQSQPVIDEGMPGTENISGGFEGGGMVKIGSTYHIFPTERAGENAMPAYYDRVKTNIGHWVSTDAVHWQRQAPIFKSSGTYSLTHDDNPLNDRRGAIWSYMPVFDKKANRWYGYYLAYTVDKEIAPNHSFGRIWRTESEKPGMAGISGPYKDGQIIMEPGLDSQLWEGRQGVDSFYPYQAPNGKWLGLYGGAYPYNSWSDYPGKTQKGWFVGLAQSNTPEGPWTRLDTSINPIRSIHPWFIENPIAYKLSDRVYITVFDGGPEGFDHHLPNMMGYSLSLDGIHWSEATYIPIETKVNKWWDIMRTPLGLVDEGNHVYTIIYAAINNGKRFHPMGRVQVKLNPEVLERRIRQLQK